MCRRTSSFKSPLEFRDFGHEERIARSDSSGRTRRTIEQNHAPSLGSLNERSYLIGDLLQFQFDLEQFFPRSQFHLLEPGRDQIDATHSEKQERNRAHYHSLSHIGN